MDANPPTPDPTSPNPQGGVGGTVGHNKSGRPPVADVNMLARAIRCGWITPEKAESLAPARMVEVLERKSPRGWIAAAKVLDAMKRTTLASVDTALRVQQQAELEGRLAEVESRLAERGDE